MLMFLLILCNLYGNIPDFGTNYVHVKKIIYSPSSPSSPLTCVSASAMTGRGGGGAGERATGSMGGDWGRGHFTGQTIIPWSFGLI